MNDVEVESFNYPGQCTTIKHLFTKPNFWTASDIGWDIDTYDGSLMLVRSDVIHYPVSIPSSSFAAAGANPTTAEYRAAFRLVISTFNSVNSLAIPDITDAQLPSAVANPTAAEMFTGAGNLVANINNTIDNVPIVLPTAKFFSVATTSGMRTELLTLISYFNNK